MAAELRDCTWCGSAKSIEHGLCQVCLMEYNASGEVIRLPVAVPPKRGSRRLTPAERRRAEARAEARAADARRVDPEAEPRTGVAD